MKNSSNGATKYQNIIANDNEPRTRRWAGTYSSPNSKRASRKATKMANRMRRHRDKYNLWLEEVQ